MAEKSLGLPIDIHGGGHDLIFPHHTNEIAQSCAAHGSEEPRDYARVWMHNGFLDFSGEKMSKSLGNVVLVHDLVKAYPGEAVRWALLSGHYRSPLDWTPELLEQARKNLDRLYGVLQRAKDIEPTPTMASSTLDPLLDDLNTPGAIASLFALATALDKAVTTENLYDAMEIKADLLGLAKVMGVLQQDPGVWFEGGADEGLKAEVEKLLIERFAARQAKNWPEADRIRDRLTELNVVVMDNPTGATWRLKE
jgi:cysteinyl-tRNA synthetase